MKFALHRDRVLPTKQGHTIEFKKGVLTHVPPECHAEVIAIGAIPEHELEVPAPSNPREPADPAERKAVLMSAFAAIVKVNERDSFAANGAPKPAALFAQTGFNIDQRELAALWIEYTQTADQQDAVAADAAAAEAKAKANKPKK